MPGIADSRLTHRFGRRRTAQRSLVLAGLLGALACGAEQQPLEQRDEKAARSGAGSGVLKPASLGQRRMEHVRLGESSRYYSVVTRNRTDPTQVRCIKGEKNIAGRAPGSP